MKKILLLTFFALISFTTNAQETIDVTVDGSGLTCSLNSQTLVKVALGSFGGYVFQSATFKIQFTGTQWELDVQNLGTIFINSSTQTPFPPCLSAGGWTYENNPATCYDQLIGLSGDGCTATLPVELIYFEAKQKEEMVIVEWQTASEENNDYFEIQKSADGESFEMIGTQEGRMISTSTTNYFFQDENISNGIYYYRLKQVDLNGQFEYFSPVAVNVFFGKNQLNVFPTVTRDVINVEMNVNHLETNLQIFSSSGQRVGDYFFSPDSTQESINIAHLSNGIYFLKVINRQNTQVVQVIKQ